jgi:hypothetical protein
MTTIHVSPLGCDDWDGTRPAHARGSCGPVASLTQALALARDGRGDTTICLRGGVYPLTRALQLGPEDCGLRIRATANEVPVLDCGRQLTGWRRADALPPGAPAAAAGKLWRAAIPGRWRIRDLAWNGEYLPPSASTSEDDWQTWPQAQLGADRASLVGDPANLDPDDPGASALLNFLPTPYTFWSNAITDVRQIDAPAGTVAYRPVQLHRPEVLKWIPFRLENLISGVSAPGRWFADDRRQEIWLWPPDDGDPNLAVLTAPFLESAISIDGRDDAPVTDFQLQGLTLRFAARGAAPTSRKPVPAWGATAAAIRASGVERLRISECTVRQCGGNAMVLQGHVRDCRVRRCEITDCGGGGILFSGGLATPEAPCAGNQITGCRIKRIGRVYWHSSGIALGMSERSLVAHNLLRNLPYAGITSSGMRHRWFAGWPRRFPDALAAWHQFGDGQAPTIESVKPLIPGRNRIAHNLVLDTMQTLHDGAAIYCHAGHHNKVVGNVVCRTGTDSSHGLYFDDEEMGSLMADNLVLRCPDCTRTERGSSIHIHHNARNTIRNNIVVGPNRLFTFPNGYGGHRVTRNIFVFSDACCAPSAPSAVAGPGDGRRLVGWSAGKSVMDDNLYWSAAGPEPVAAWLKGWRDRGFDRDSVVADPQLSGDGADLQIAADSPATACGFRQPNWSRVGPRR